MLKIPHRPWRLITSYHSLHANPNIQSKYVNNFGHAQQANHIIVISFDLLGKVTPKVKRTQKANVISQYYFKLDENE